MSGGGHGPCGEADLDGCPGPGLRGDADLASVVVHDAVDDGHAEAAALVERAVERLEDGVQFSFGDADAFVSGLTREYPDVARPALQLFGTRPGTRHSSGVYIMVIKGRVYFFTDTTINIDPDAETLAEIERNGFLLDVEGLKILSKELEHELDKMMETIAGLAGGAVGSRTGAAL